ncbi:ADP-glyceromanno-heptose 6-epimerase [Tenacibaculum xiamenense]|uniref:ADP-glyceromanno-heptose 6-epimerase n=1 Tax=Tenacibaculum xiamenense TaxID=1261553 RepID=UPI003893AD45
MKHSFNNKTILITGGAGFIGSNVAFFIQNNYPQSNIIIFDIFRKEDINSEHNPKSFGHYKNLIGFKGNIICGDISNDDDLRSLNYYDIDYIFHFAAISNTRIYEQETIMRTNVNSFYKLLYIAKNHQAQLVYASSASVYGLSPSPQKIGNETPNTPYGFSKYAMDQIASYFVKKNPSIKIIGLRFFNVYGEKEYFKGNTASMIIQLGHQILACKKPRLFNESDKIMRDFVYIKDVVKACILASNSQRSGIYNIGSGMDRSFQNIVEILQKELNTDLSISYFENPYQEYQIDTRADISLSQEFLNYTPSYNLEEGIKDYLPYIKETFKWISK